MAARPGPSPVDGGAGRGCRDGDPHVGRPHLRALRAGVFAVVCVLLSAGLHTAAGGGAVELPVLAGATAATWVGAYALAARRRGRGALLTACLVAQYGLHNLFTGPETPPAGAATGPAGHHTGHLPSPDGLLGSSLAPPGGLFGSSLATPDGLFGSSLATPDGALGPALAPAEAGGSIAMPLVHVAVALISGWWMERGETALATLLRLAVTSVRGFLVQLLVALVCPVTVAGPAVSAASTAAAPPPPPHVSAISRRGPPLAFSVR
ncbi:hypothetical protein [Nonomuraea indica]|uniref:hypothetical protein n=1 Tax=Nonomuraea indica TaxID=1581193 RepID=UPI000C7C6826|nr:hypothetical protein [Nonomuraea indica]